MQSFRWSTEKAPDPKPTLPPFSVRICPFFNPLPLQIGQYYHCHHCPQTPYLEQRYHNHHGHPPVKSPTLIERWKCRRWLKKVQSSRYFGANIQRLTCNKHVVALHPWYYYNLEATKQTKEPGPRTREDIPSRTLENWFDEVAEAGPGTRPPRRPENCNSLLLYMGKAGGNEGVGQNGNMLILEEILAWETA